MTKIFDVEKIEINAAFYELFESVFGEDFFTILTSVRATPRVIALSRKVKAGEELTDEEKMEIIDSNKSTFPVMQRYTSRIAYIGSKLYERQYSGSKTDYYAFLAEYDSSVFLDKDVIAKVWEKVNGDRKVPDSAKNA